MARRAIKPEFLGQSGARTPEPRCLLLIRGKGSLTPFSQSQGFGVVRFCVGFRGFIIRPSAFLQLKPGSSSESGKLGRGNRISLKTHPDSVPKKPRPADGTTPRP